MRNRMARVKQTNEGKKSGVNYIPEEAIKISEKAKCPEVEKEKHGALHKKDLGIKQDPFSEARVSCDHPTAKEAKTTIPDDTVLPG